MATRGKGINLSGAITLSGVGKQTATLHTATAGNSAEVVLSQLSMGVQTTTAKGTASPCWFGLEANSIPLIWGIISDLADAANQQLVTLSGGTVPYDLFTVAVENGGVISLDINTAGGFFNTTSVAVAKSLVDTGDPGSFVSPSLPMASKLYFPIHLNASEALNLWVEPESGMGASSSDIFRYAASLGIVENTVIP